MNTKYVITEIEQIDSNDETPCPEITSLEIANSLDQAKDIYTRLVNNMLLARSDGPCEFYNVSSRECHIVCPCALGNIMYSYAITEPNKN